MIIPEDALVGKGYLLILFPFPSRNLYPEDLCESLTYMQSFFLIPWFQTTFIKKLI